MAHSLTLEVPDDLFQPILQQAREAGKTPEEWALARLRQQLPLNEEEQCDVSHEDRTASIAELVKLAGSADLGYPTGVENEQIDADLSKEYAETHEDDA